MSALAAAFAVAAAVLVFGWFVRLERTDRRERVFAMVLGVLLVEMLVNGSQQDVPNGLFRIPFPIGGGLRPPDVLIPLALAARMAVADVPRRFSTTALLWSAFLTWYAAASVTGYLYGNPTEQVLFQARSVLYVGGGFALAAGVRPQRIVEAKVLGWWGMLFGGAALAIIGLAVAGFDIGIHLPGLRIDDLAGGIHPDGRLALVIFGGIVLTVENARPQRRLLVSVFGVMMIGASLTQRQAGSLVAMAVVVTVLALVSLTPTWRRRAQVTPTEAALLAAVLVVAAIPLLGAGEKVAPLDPFSNVERALFSDSQADTTEDRLQLWSEAWKDIADRPIMGSGLGVQHVLDKDWPDVDTLTTAHNVGVDVLVRSGLVGLTLLLAAIALSVRDALEAWRRHPNNEVAMLALGALVGLAAIASKAMVGSTLEKFREAVMLGILLGLLSALARATTEERTSRRAGSEERKESVELGVTPYPPSP